MKSVFLEKLRIHQILKKQFPMKGYVFTSLLHYISVAKYTLYDI